MEDNRLMAELESIISNAAKDIKAESAQNALQAMEGMLRQWKQDDNIVNGQAWFIGLADTNALFPDDLSNAEVIETDATGTPDAGRMAVRCIATPTSPESFIGMLEDPRFIMVAHQLLRADGVYGMFTSNEGNMTAVGLDTSGMVFIVEGHGNRFAKSYSFGDKDEPEWNVMGMDKQTMEWIAAVMRAFMAPRMLIANSPHMYKAFITGIAAGEDEILEVFGVTAEQLLEGLNDI